MLKIKDNVNLSRLEIYGLKPRYDELTGRIIRYVKDNGRTKNNIYYCDTYHGHMPFWDITLKTMIYYMT